MWSELMESAVETDGVWCVDVPGQWSQGRSVFGGLQAAIGWIAMRALVPAEVPLRSLQVTFMAPVPTGPVRARAQVLRAGRSATHVEARLIGDAQQPLCTMIGIFGAQRPSQVLLRPQQPVVDDAGAIPFRFVPGMTPDFTRYFSARWLRGGLPFSGEASIESIVELSMHDREGVNASESHVLALADYIPPIGLSHLRTPAAGSSMTWMLEFLNDDLHTLPLQGWRMDGRLDAALNGYTSQGGILWGPDGRAAALSRQNMVVFG